MIGAIERLEGAQVARGDALDERHVGRVVTALGSRRRLPADRKRAKQCNPSFRRLMPFAAKRFIEPLARARTIRRRDPFGTCPKTASHEGRLRHNCSHDDRWRRCLPGAPRARRALRRPPLRRRDVDGRLLPADLPRAHAGAAQLPLLRVAGAGRGGVVPALPEVPARDRARPGPGVDGDGRVADARAPGGERARRIRGRRRRAERRRRSPSGSASAIATCAASSSPSTA